MLGTLQPRKSFKKSRIVFEKEWERKIKQLSSSSQVLSLATLSWIFEKENINKPKEKAENYSYNSIWVQLKQLRLSIKAESGICFAMQRNFYVKKAYPTIH